MNNLSSVYTIDELYEIAYRGSYTDSERQLAIELLAYREAQGKMVGIIRQVCGNKTLVWANDVPEGTVLYAAPPLPVVSAELALVPRKLTAENGAKGALLGEFLETKYISCPECFGDDDCESCDGSGRIKVDVTVSWDTIKRIYSSAIDLFCKEDDMLAAAPKPGV